MFVFFRHTGIRKRQHYDSPVTEDVLMPSGKWLWRSSEEEGHCPKLDGNYSQNGETFQRFVFAEDHFGTTDDTFLATTICEFAGTNVASLTSGTEAIGKSLFHASGKYAPWNAIDGFWNSDHLRGDKVYHSDTVQENWLILDLKRTCVVKMFYWQGRPWANGVWSKQLSFSLSDGYEPSKGVDDQFWIGCAMFPYEGMNSGGDLKGVTCFPMAVGRFVLMRNGYPLKLQVGELAVLGMPIEDLE